MMGRKGQVEIGAIIAAVVGIFMLIILAPVFTEMFDSIGCQSEKSTISTLQGQLQDCQNQVAAEKQKAQDAANSLGDCQGKLASCQDQLSNCNKNLTNLQEECAKKEQPRTEYYFIKVFSNKIILFESIVLYNLHLFGLFLSFGITFTVKLFDVEIEIHTLNKKNQRKIVKAIKEYLARNPYSPILFMAAIILLSNLLLMLV